MDKQTGAQKKNASTAITQGDVLNSNMHNLAFFETVEDQAGKMVYIFIAWGYRTRVCIFMVSCSAR